MRVPLAAALLLLLAPPSFDALKKKAGTLESLPKTVTALVGRCEDGDAFENQECEQNMKAQRKALDGKRVYLFLGPPEIDKLRFEGERGSKMRLLWTPIHDAGNGLALTMGTPRRLSAKGNIIIPTKVIDAVPAPGVLTSEVQRLVRIGQLNVEVVGRFHKPWTLSGKGKRIDGVAFDLEAIRFSHARTGKPVLEMVE